MSEQRIATPWLRHAVGFGMLLVALGGTGLAFAVLPDAVAGNPWMQWGVAVPVALATVELLQRLDGDVGLLGRWAKRLRE